LNVALRKIKTGMTQVPSLHETRLAPVGVNNDSAIDDLEWPEPQSPRRAGASHLWFCDALSHRGELPRACSAFRRAAVVSSVQPRGRLGRSNPVCATVDAIIINPAAYSFTSIALIDALKTFEGPIIEVHISNIHARDKLHRHSKISASAKAVICGLGPYGYVVAMQAALQILGKLPEHLPAALRNGPR
jgi:hypothetical protein